MYDLVFFSCIPLAALLGSGAYTLVMAYRLRDWRPVLFVAVLLVMALHQANEIHVFLSGGADAALSGFGEYPETTANLLASAATVLLLRFVDRERTLSTQLEEMVEERTAELESFTYSVSHDLRTPLRAIDGYTQLLRQEHAGALDAEGTRLLRLVHENTQRMGALIDDLLTLSRLGRRDLSRTRVDVAALARETFSACCDTEGYSPAALTFEVEPLPEARADPNLLRHALANLFSNALKFTRDEAHPHIRVGSRRQNGRPVFYVQDNGVGFDMAYADKLFGAFERLHDHDDFEGTGIGLAIVDRIVRRHGGEVWAEGTEGEGTTVYFTLPDADDADHE
jgi:signal transduction histidine kinase